MIPSDALKAIEKDSMRIIAEKVTSLFSDFVLRSPVETGAFRGAWDVKQTGLMEWKITNNMEYATVLFDGRRLVAGKWYGSEQWVEGGEAMLARFNIELQSDLDKIRR